MNKYDDIKDEINKLINQGDRIYNGLIVLDKIIMDEDFSPSEKEKTDYMFFVEEYEIWYSASLYLIKLFLPERTDDFVILYRDSKRKDITWQNYTISDAVQSKATITHSFHPGNASKKLSQQIAMVKSCLDRFDKKIYDIQTILQADIFDSEIESAKHLHKLGYLRAAGAISGVVLEKHLRSVCDNHNVNITKKNPTIADYNDKLKDVVYNVAEWRRIQRLGDLRNLCDHDKSTEPTAEEVMDLIKGTEKTIKTIF